MGNIGSAIAPASVLIENLGGVTLRIASFESDVGSSAHIINWQGATNVWNSSMPAVVGHWFQETKQPTQEGEGVDVSLASSAEKGVAGTYGQFKFTSGTKQKEGKLMTITLD